MNTKFLTVICIVALCCATLLSAGVELAEKKLDNAAVATLGSWQPVGDLTLTVNPAQKSILIMTVSGRVDCQGITQSGKYVAADLLVSFFVDNQIASGDATANVTAQDNSPGNNPHVWRAQDLYKGIENISEPVSLTQKRIVEAGQHTVNLQTYAVNGPASFYGMNVQVAIVPVDVAAATAAPTNVFTKDAMDLQTNDFHAELYSPDKGNNQLFTKLRFHQSNQYFGWLGYKLGGFTMWDLNNNRQADLNVGNVTAAGDLNVTGKILQNGQPLSVSTGSVSSTFRDYVTSDVDGNQVKSGFYLGNPNHGLRRNAGSNDVELYTTSGNILINGGNVGIGTSDPKTPLAINQDGHILSLTRKTDAPLYMSFSDGASFTHFIGADRSNGTGLFGSGLANAFAIGTTKDQAITFHTNNDVKPRMTITGTGDVYMGVNPLKFSSGWTSFPDGMTNGAEISNDVSNYKCLMIVGNKSAGSERRVGIWDRLDVNGTLYVNGQLVNASSRELKENITDISAEEALVTLKQLEPKKYNYKTSKDEQNLGFIAEDVPDLVAMNDRKGLNPMDLIAVLTKVVQHQQQEIEELKQAINAK